MAIRRFPGAVAQVLQNKVLHNRLLHGSTAARDFKRDCLFGATGRHDAQVPSLASVSLAARMAAHAPVLHEKSFLGADDTKQAHGEYRRAVEQEHVCAWEHAEEGGSPPISLCTRYTVNPFDALGFAVIGESGGSRRCADLPRQVVATSLRRNGHASFYFGHFCLHDFFGRAARVEVEHGVPYLQYAQSMRQADAALDEPGRRKAQPTFTGVELTEFIEGGLKDAGVRFLAFHSGDADLRVLDASKVVEFYKLAMDAVCSEANKAHLKETGQMLPLARDAIACMQYYVHGQAGPLPSASAA